MENNNDWQSGTLLVVRNQEGYYSIWPSYKEIPSGWIDVNVKGTKEECLQYIEKVWNPNLAQSDKNSS